MQVRLVFYLASSCLCLLPHLAWLYCTCECSNTGNQAAAPDLLDRAICPFQESVSETVGVGGSLYCTGHIYFLIFQHSSMCPSVMMERGGSIRPGVVLTRKGQSGTFPAVTIIRRRVSLPFVSPHPLSMLTLFISSLIQDFASFITHILPPSLCLLVAGQNLTPGPC